VIQCSTAQVRFPSAGGRDDLQLQLQALAREMAAGLSELDPAQGKELLSAFVSSLFLSVADEDRRRERCQKQAAGIAAAKERGVRFGPAPNPLPEHIDECYKAWRDGQMTAAQAAEKCGVSREVFYRASARIRQEESCAV